MCIPAFTVPKQARGLSVMTHYRTRNGRIRPRSWFWPLSLFLAVSGSLLTAGIRAQAQTTDAKIITIPPPLPTPLQRPGGSSSGPTAAVAAEAVQRPGAATGSEFEARVGMPSPVPGQNMVPPPPAPGLGVPRVIPIEPMPGQPGAEAPAATRPKLIHLRRDATGLVPARPPGPTPLRPSEEVAKDVSNLIEKIQEPEAEISLVAGECKVIQTKRTLTRLVISNPLVADVELLTDQPEVAAPERHGEVVWHDQSDPVG